MTMSRCPFPSAFCGVILMPRVVLFAEDFAHETIIKALIRRLAATRHLTLNEPETRLASGGHGKVIRELRRYLREVRRRQQRSPDLLIVGRDANCKGFRECKRELDGVTAGCNLAVIYAIPDPHIERWLLLDPAAFKAVLGKSCAAPDRKCERDRYKQLLLAAIRQAGRTPIVGGLEHAEDLVNAMNLPRLERTDDSFRRFVRDVRSKFKEWEQA
jgi:hypothetical protein